jgi:hypothetical protein
VEVSLSSNHDDPVLVSWRFGLGKAVAFTSDAKNRWAAPWVSNAGTFAKFWAQTIRWTVRSTARANLDTQVEINQRKGKVVIDVVDAKGNFVNMLDIRGSVAGTNVSPKLRIDQTAPGRYEGEFDAPEKGQYMVALSYTDETGTPRTHRVGAAVPYSPEYHDLSANTAVLNALADRTGGTVYPSLGAKVPDQEARSLWRHDRRTHSAPDDLWPLLVLLAALLLPVDIGVRRLMVSRGARRAASGRTRRNPGAGARSSAASAAAGTGDGPAVAGQEVCPWRRGSAGNRGGDRSRGSSDLRYCGAPGFTGLRRPCAHDAHRLRRTQRDPGTGHGQCARAAPSGTGARAAQRTGRTREACRRTEAPGRAAGPA